MLTLLVVETTDVVFAVDSIPAIFAITADPFLVFTSNVFAILGLRSLYGALAGMIDKFRYLKVALSIILLIIGVKMLTVEWLKEMLGKNFNFYLLGVVDHDSRGRDPHFAHRRCAGELGEGELRRQVKRKKRPGSCALRAAARTVVFGVCGRV